MTGLRFVAAAMIVIHHSRGTFQFVKHFCSNLQLDTGVSFFFVLSGFILTHVYPEIRGARALRNFFIARISRIWPAHVFTFAIALAMGMQGHSDAPGSPPLAAIGLANVAMVHAWVPARGWFFSFNPVSWSISTELFFYLLFPLLIANFARTWWWKLTLAFGAAAASVIACELWQIPSHAAAGPFEVNRAGLLYIGPLARVAEFALGMTAAHWWKRVPHRGPSRPITATLLELLLIAICAVHLLGLHRLGHMDSTDMPNLFGQSLTNYLIHSAAAPAFALLIVVFANHRGAISRFLATPVLVFLGEISFSIYLLHRILLDAPRLLNVKLPEIGPAAFLIWLAFWGVLLIAAWAVWFYIERPLRTLLLRLSGYQKAKIASPSPTTDVFTS